MSMELATKLKIGITFGPKCAAVKLTVYQYEIDGYEMLYNLISHLHPLLYV